MNYQGIKEGVFIARPNRFIARVSLVGEEVVCHVKNTGRCKELLVPGAKVYVEPARTKGRKTPYSLIAVEKGGLLINMDSQIPNRVLEESVSAALPGARLIPEQTYLDSRYDFYVETEGNSGYIEVKGVTLEWHGHAFFPDAPTLRGLKHVHGLTRLAKEGRLAYLVFIIQFLGAVDFYPNTKTQPEFLSALQEAQAAGVHILAFDCQVTPNSIGLHAPLPVKLKNYRCQPF